MTGRIRYFSPEVIGDYSTMREWEDLEAMDEIRGGGGDELEYDELTDMFGYSEGSGLSPVIWVRNPCPGDLIRGAIEVARIADESWSRSGA